MSRWRYRRAGVDGARIPASAIYGDPTKGHGILNNRIYVGVVEWGRTEARRRDSRREALAKPREEWTTVKDDSLRIVDDALWRKVRDRIEERSRLIGERVRRGLAPHKARAVGRGPAYLLSGILRCASCNSTLVVSGQGQAYACSLRVNGGACGNALRVPRARMEERVLAAIRDQLLGDEAMGFYLKELRACVKEIESSRARSRPDRDRRRRKLEAEVANLADAIAAGGLRRSPVLAERLRTTEAELSLLSSIAGAPSRHGTCGPDRVPAEGAGPEPRSGRPGARGTRGHHGTARRRGEGGQRQEDREADGLARRRRDLSDEGRRRRVFK